MNLPDGNPPIVSLLVAIRNEAAHIEACIRSLLQQDYPSDKLEVLVYDGTSDDVSWEMVEKLTQGKPNYKMYNNPKRIQAAAWNMGISACKGEIISIASGHVEFAPDYVSKAVETLQRTGADMVGGTVRANSPGMVGEAIALAMSTPFGVGGARFRYTDQEEVTDTVFMGFCRRAVYEKIGGFDEELVRNQDDEFSYRLLKAGGKIICNPAIVSTYYNRATLTSFWKQYFQYGFWKVRVLQKHPRQMRLRQFVPPAFVLALLVSLLLGFVFTPGIHLFVLILMAYIFSNLIASFLTSKKRGWSYLPLLPFVNAILHFSYGLGFLVGLVRFAGRWGDKRGKVPEQAQRKDS